MPHSVVPTADAHVELELKLFSDDAIPEARVLARLGALADVGEPVAVRQTDQYLDDADRTLASAGLAARCRTKGAERQVQVKPVPLLPGLLMERRELSLTLPRGAEPGPAIRDLVRATWPLEPGDASAVQLTLETARTRYPVDGGTFTAELCIDRVEASAPTTSARARFEELELEYLGGDTSAFSVVAEGLRAGLDLSASARSKYVRSLRLLGLPGYEVTPEGPAFSREAPTDEVARAILLHLLQTIRHHEPGTRVGADSERLHKMRVATRRLRSALSIFRVAFPSAVRTHLAGEFRWLAAILGEVRDLDVHQINQADWCPESAPERADGRARLARVLHDRWDAARVGLLEGLSSARYAALLERAERAFSEDPGYDADHPARVPVARMAGKVIKKRAKRFRKAARLATQTADPEDAHDLRVVGKKLRYTIERFAPLLGDALDAQTTRLKAFQDVLGAFQDQASAARVIETLKDEALSERPRDAAYISLLECAERKFAAQLSSVATVVEDALAALGGLDATKAFARIAKQTLRTI